MSQRKFVKMSAADKRAYGQHMQVSRKNGVPDHIASKAFFNGNVQKSSSRPLAAKRSYSSKPRSFKQLRRKVTNKTYSPFTNNRMAGGSRNSSNRMRRVRYPAIKGRGDYSSAMSTGSSIGRTIGNALGFGTIGSTLGAIGGAAFHWLTGRGDYNVAQNTLINMGTTVPVFKQGSRSTIVSHKDYIGDVTSSTSFVNRVYPINAALSSTMPWLSQVATNYEQYRIHGMVFYFKSTSANALNSTDTALGTVIMCTEYDSTRPDFSNKSQMMNHQYCTSSKPSCDLIHPIECAPPDTSIELLYSRTGPATGDPRLYDLGKFQLATEGMQQANVKIGELWVSYEVELVKPKLGGSGFSIASTHYRISQVANGTIDSTYYFGQTPPEPDEYTPGSNIPLEFAVGSDTGFYLPSEITSGRYMCDLSWYGSTGAGAFTQYDPTVSNGATLVPMWADGTFTHTGTASAASHPAITNTQFVFDVSRVVSDPPVHIDFIGSPTFPTSVDYCDVFLTQVNSSVSIMDDTDLIGSSSGYHVVRQKINPPKLNSSPQKHDYLPRSEEEQKEKPRTLLQMLVEDRDQELTPLPMKVSQPSTPHSDVPPKKGPRDGPFYRPSSVNIPVRPVK